MLRNLLDIFKVENNSKIILAFLCFVFCHILTVPKGMFHVPEIESRFLGQYHAKQS